ncbi:hypothetical protein ACIBED_15370 [Rhodococcus coprophilus]|uniref:Lipoprotein n=1 Tax=Rhodococcus coprophilus TaxID=38310 RepID=A0A2X4TTV8_9NOCA|nr:hypothetical protein [Rhodococcus coprophilus]MBM7457808.1 hypothetical protein [Rhodococcus coprophilus]SQI30431.1 Uncharacterised protein [Rhodococcus coprophilus]
MKKTVAALFGAGVVLFAGACGSSDGTASADETTTTTTTTSASSSAQGGAGVQLGNSYEDNCEALLPYLDELEGWGQDRVQAAQAVADAQQQLPQWQELDAGQQADTLRAIENAGKGEC